MNLAARLQSSAPVDGVLIGEATFRELGPRAIVEPLPPMRVKGMREPVTAYVLHRLATPVGDAPRATARVLVGARPESELQLQLVERAPQDRDPLGDGGVRLRIDRRRPRDPVAAREAPACRSISRASSIEFSTTPMSTFRTMNAATRMKLTK